MQFDNSLGNKDIFSKNLKKYMDVNNIDRNKLCADLNFKYSTVSDWINAKIYPRIDKIEILANYFDIDKSDLIEENIDLSKIPGVIPIKKIKKIPILGTIACGEPILAVENIDGYFAADADIVKGDFALRCKGDSMIDANIFEGDIVFFKETPIVENGQIAAVVIDDEATLKKFFKTESSIILQPCNSSYEPIVVSKEANKSVRIIGLMVGVYSNRSK